MSALVWVTGFPRSGTTWLQRQLLKSPSCDGIDEEQGLHFLWDYRREKSGILEYPPIMERAVNEGGSC